MKQSNRSGRSRKSGTGNKPPKPYADFPLSPDANGRWCKRIRGTLRYFGRWGRIRNGTMVREPDDGWKNALELFQVQKDDLYAGRTPRTSDNSEGATVRELCNRFLTANTRKLEAGKLSRRSLDEFRETTDILITQFGKDRLADDIAADDFEALLAEVSKRWGPVRQGNFVTRVKSVFRYGYENGILTVDPQRCYGSEFVKPDKSVLRRHRAKQGKRMLTPAEINKLLNAASPQLKAMTLLGVNCGFGNHDVATLQESAVDLDAGSIDFPRPKTGIERRCPLWPETIAALRESLSSRPEPNTDAEGYVFIDDRPRRTGQPFYNRRNDKTEAVTAVIGELMRTTNVHRHGIGFYTLRHVFQTIADGSSDPIAVKTVMGHADHSISAMYREGVEDGELLAVSDHVRHWLFGDDGDTDGDESGRTVERDDVPSRPTPGPGEGAAPALKLYVG